MVQQNTQQITPEVAATPSPTLNLELVRSLEVAATPSPTKNLKLVRSPEVAATPSPTLNLEIVQSPPEVTATPSFSPEPPLTEPSDNSESGGLSVGAIIAIVITLITATLVAASGIALAILILRKRRYKGFYVSTDGTLTFSKFKINL